MVDTNKKMRITATLSKEEVLKLMDFEKQTFIDFDVKLKHNEVMNMALEFFIRNCTKNKVLFKDVLKKNGYLEENKENKDI